MEGTGSFESIEAVPDEKPVATFELGNAITFGRDTSNDVALADDAWVSPRHARIEKRDEYILVDLGSNSGIHHNGKRVVDRVRLEDDDVFAIGRHDFVFRAGRVYRSERSDERNPVLIEAYDLTVQVVNSALRRRGRLEQLIDDVSFVVRRGTLLGIVGPSGSGKSTLLRAITGSQPVTQGRLLFDKEDLYRDPGPHRGIGMVPQEDIVHRQLTVRRALMFAAALRCPRGLTRRQRLERVGDVVRQLGIEAQLATPIETLSGGQRKRTSVAMELLTVPSLLCLDEPTSGLDPALDRDVMGGLRNLAKGDKTVIVTTHSPLHLDACDYVLVLSQGRMVYFGPPGRELFEFFTGAEVYSDVFAAITDEPAVWAQRYRTSAVFGRHVGQEQLSLLQQEAQRRHEDPTVRISRPRALAATVPNRRTGPRPGQASG